MPFSNQMPDWKKQKAVEMRRNPTPAEAALWSVLRRKNLGYKFRRQTPMLGYIADFYCPSLKLIVEVDGDIHDKVYDEKRDDILFKKGIKTLRFKNAEVLNVAEVKKRIFDFVKGWCSITDVFARPE